MRSALLFLLLPGLDASLCAAGKASGALCCAASCPSCGGRNCSGFCCESHILKRAVACQDPLEVSCLLQALPPLPQTAYDARLAAVLSRWGPAWQRFLLKARLLRVRLLRWNFTLLLPENDGATLRHVLREQRADSYGLAAPLPPGAVVVDVGGHGGVVAMLVRRLHPHARVVSLEPAPPSRLLFEANLALNGIENVELWPLALAARGGKRILHYSVKDSTGASTVYDGAEKHFQGLEEPGRRYEVEAVTLRALLEKLNDVALMKLDCEGCEYEVLLNNKKLLKRLKRVVGEVHPGMFLYARPEGAHLVPETHALICERGWHMRHLDCQNP